MGRGITKSIADFRLQIAKWTHFVIPAWFWRGSIRRKNWIPAFAGMTKIATSLLSQRGPFGALLAMTKRVLPLAITILLLVSSFAHAYPRSVNFQTAFLLGAKSIADGSYEVYFRILDSAEQVMYEEFQEVLVSGGMVSAMVGEGFRPDKTPAGGLSPEVMDPARAKFLEIEFADPKDYPPGPQRLEIGAVPFSIYAEKALGVADGSITAASLADGAVEFKHFAAGAVQDVYDDLKANYFPGEVAMMSDLQNVKTSFKSVTGSKSIGVQPDFVYSAGINVQQVLRDFDLAIRQRQENVNRAVTTASGLVEAEAVARAGADSSLQTQINTKLDKSGGTMTGVLDMGGQEIANVGNVDGVDVSNLQSGKLDKSGGEMSGTLNMGGQNITNVGSIFGMVNGINVANLASRVSENLDKSGGTMTGDLMMGPNPSTGVGAKIDMGGQRVENVGVPDSSNDVARLVDIHNAFVGAGPVFDTSVNGDLATSPLNLLSTNGYVKMGGVIIQWGTEADFTNIVWDRLVVMDFPIEFPNGVLAVIPSLIHEEGQDLDASISARIIDNSQIEIQIDEWGTSNNRLKATYLAIGY